VANCRFAESPMNRAENLQPRKVSKSNNVGKRRNVKMILRLPSQSNHKHLQKNLRIIIKNMKTAGIIGGSGFIGSHITKRFLAENFNVKVSSTDVSNKDNTVIWRLYY